MTVAADQGTAMPDAARPRRFTGLLPHVLVRYRRPQWWQELAIIAISYWFYSIGRNAVPEPAALAFRHGHSVLKLQNKLHLNFELSLNHFVAAHDPLAQVMYYCYATLHFFITAAVLVWLY